MSHQTIVVGTRGSPLALQQTAEVISRLQEAHPQLHFRVHSIRTEGDRAQNRSLAELGGRGVFVKELEAALLRHHVDLAVHSLKDMPSQLPPGLTLGAIPQRTDPRDVLISRVSQSLAQLPPGAVLATGSLRRAAQLKARRPDLKTVDIRGNVDTRLRKLDAGGVDGLVLAAAGLIRLGLMDRITEYLALDVCLPAVGQGALGVEATEEDEALLALVAAIDHFPTRTAVTAERAFLRALGGGCQVPMAAYGRLEGDSLVLTGLVADPTGVKLVRAQLAGSPHVPQELGCHLAEELLQSGAAELRRGIP